MRNVAHLQQADVGDDAEGFLDEWQAAGNKESGAQAPGSTLARFGNQLPIGPDNVQRLAFKNAHSAINDEEREARDESDFDKSRSRRDSRKQDDRCC